MPRTSSFDLLRRGRILRRGGRRGGFLSGGVSADEEGSCAGRGKKARWLWRRLGELVEKQQEGGDSKNALASREGEKPDATRPPLSEAAKKKRNRPHERRVGNSKSSDKKEGKSGHCKRPQIGREAEDLV